MNGSEGAETLKNITRGIIKLLHGKIIVNKLSIKKECKEKTSSSRCVGPYEAVCHTAIVCVSIMCKEGLKGWLMIARLIAVQVYNYDFRTKLKIGILIRLG